MCKNPFVKIYETYKEPFKDLSKTTKFESIKEGVNSYAHISLDAGVSHFLFVTQ